MMTELDPLFLDTSPFIYLVENDARHAQKIDDFLATEFGKETPIVTSALTVCEFSVKPNRDNDKELLYDFERTLTQFNVSIFDINLKVAHGAAQLRSRHKMLKTVDALQISCALNYGCTRFLTNDFRLKSITELKVILVEDLA